MFKNQFYNIIASFLVPAYNLPSGVLSHYVTTQRGQHNRGNIEIDVWLVSAEKDNPKKSMIASLSQEESAYQAELDKATANGRPNDNSEQAIKIRRLEHGKNMFAQLVKQANDIVYHKDPDDEFLKIANRNLSGFRFAEYQLDLKNYLYLAGLSKYEER